VLACLFVQWLQVQALGGGWNGLLSVGELDPIRPTIEAELEGLQLDPSYGHDGQVFYGIALDPGGLYIPSLIDHPGYRYRRILFPVLAGGFGLTQGEALLLSMIAWSAAAVGVATSAIRGLSLRLGLSAWTTLAVVANPGVWLSAQLLTSDALALALIVMAVLAYLDDHPLLAAGMVAAAALAKEPSLLVAFGLAADSWFRGKRRPAAWLALAPVLPFAAWIAWVDLRIGGALESGDTLTPPLLGLLDSAGRWSSTPVREACLAILTLTGLVAAFLVPMRRSSFWRWLLWPWVGLGLVLSHWVWDFGNNSIRVLAPMLTLLVPAAMVAGRSHPCMDTATDRDQTASGDPSL
jgi:hypothetical protein